MLHFSPESIDILLIVTLERCECKANVDEIGAKLNLILNLGSGYYVECVESVAQTVSVRSWIF